jgi:glucokinase
MALYLGLDFGGTKLAAGFADESGRLLSFARCPTDPSAGPIGALAAMRALAENMGQAAPQAVGISFGGPVDSSRQRCLLSHHGPGWEDFPLVERVAEIWHRPVVMDNDANAAALGEFCFGAGRDQRNLLYVTVSTGIGGGVILDGEIYRGSHGLSGEIGHTIVAADGPLCACGKRGCLEAFASGPAISRTYAREARLASDKVTAENVFANAASGDQIARQVLDRAIQALGIALANASNLLDPDIIVIGGGVSGAGDALFRPLSQIMHSLSAPAPADVVAIVPAELGDAVGVLGAVALVSSTGR